MVHTEPGEWLHAELGRILGSDADEAVMTAVDTAFAESVCGVLNQLATVRRLLMFFNSAPDWKSVLEEIRDMLRVDAVQIGCLDGLNNLQWHVLPSDQRLDEDFASLVHNGLMAEDESPDGTIRRLGALLSVKDDLLGIIIVIRIHGEPFSDCERVILKFLADELATTLHYLDLYGLVVAQADRLANLLHDHPEKADEVDPAA